ncbi:MAG TPA: glycosyltransferase family 87 protein [Bacteroidia bacterium]|jgi:hypothetical protein|nr:glycosyltransferase family 87 protein [Bacteroidia bacterium]
MKNILALLFIDYNKLRSAKYISIISLFFIGFCIVSFIMGRDVGLQADFTVFWQAGKNYINGVSLYSQIGGAERYIYPPFAAMCFQLLALFSLHQAAALFCFCNLLFWVMIIYYTQKIILQLAPQSTHIKQALFIGFILSFRYFLYHTWFIQMNELVLLLSLAAVYNHIIKKDHYAIPLVVAATFIKIIPLFILIWILSKSNFKNYLRTAIYTALCIIIPLLLRGFHQGVIDLQEYYVTFLQPFQEGRVEPKLQNYGLSAALYKVFSYTEDGDKYHYIITILPAATISLIYKCIILFLLLAFAGMLIYGRLKKAPVSLFELSFILLFTNLVSGITWEYHLVSLFFVASVLALDYFNSKNKNRVVFYTLGFLLFFNLIIGGDTVGYYLYYKSCGGSILTWMLLLLCIYNIARYIKQQKESKTV